MDSPPQDVFELLSENALFQEYLFVFLLNFNTHVSLTL